MIVPQLGKQLLSFVDPLGFQCKDYNAMKRIYRNVTRLFTILPPDPRYYSTSRGRHAPLLCFTARAQGIVGGIGQKGYPLALIQAKVQLVLLSSDCGAANRDRLGIKGAEASEARGLRNNCHNNLLLRCFVGLGWNLLGERNCTGNIILTPVAILNICWLHCSIAGLTETRNGLVAGTRCARPLLRVRLASPEVLIYVPFANLVWLGL